MGAATGLQVHAFDVEQPHVSPAARRRHRRRPHQGGVRIELFFADDLDEPADYICERSRRAVPAGIAKLPRGEYRSAMRIDGYERPLDPVARLEISGDGITVDHDGAR